MIDSDLRLANGNRVSIEAYVCSDGLICVSVFNAHTNERIQSAYGSSLSDAMSKASHVLKVSQDAQG